MFFKGSGKKKVDSRVRFQSAQFTKKLGEARNYRRTARPLPESSFQLWLTRMGLGNRWTQAAVLIILAAIFYLVYIPNFLSVDRIEISGLGESDRVVAEGTVRGIITSAPFYNPQRNLIFLSKERVKKSLIEQGAIYSVGSIKKDFTSRTLIINVLPKVEAFTLLNYNRTYLIYNDGSIKNELAFTAIDWLEKSPANTIRLKNSSEVRLGDNKHYLSSDFSSKLLTLNEQFKKMLGRVPQYIELQLPQPTQTVNQETGEVAYQALDLSFPVHPIEARAYLTVNEDNPRTYYILFDMQEDVTTAVSRLQLLLSQTAPERYQRLAYIDMRLPNKSFICLIDTACVQSPPQTKTEDPVVETPAQ